MNENAVNTSLGHVFESVLAEEGLNQRARLALLLTAGATMKDAAKAVGVHRNTATRWQTTDVEFQTYMETLQGEMRVRIAGLLFTAAEKAVATLIELLSEDQEPIVRERAARTVLNMLRTNEEPRMAAGTRISMPNGLTLEAILLTDNPK